MGRPAKFSNQLILDAAAAITADAGPAAATMAAIGAAIGAPNASLYHRFKSRDELLGRMWLQKAAWFQDRAEAGLRLEDPIEAGLAAALSLPAAVREDLLGARIMLLHRREDFASANWPPEMTKEAERLGTQVATMISTLTARLFGDSSAQWRDTVVFAAIEVPYACVRRHVAAGRKPPARVDDWIRRTYEAIVVSEARTAKGARARGVRRAMKRLPLARTLR